MFKLRQARCVISAAWLVPDLRNSSYTDSPRSLPEAPMRNVGDGEFQVVEFSPALPSQSAFFFWTYQHGSC